MLTRPHPFNSRIKPRARQNGVVLMIALIVLVAMTLAGIALVRSVDTTNIIAGNLAFQQAATHSGDQGVEAAIACLTTANTNPVNLESDYPACGYIALWNPASIPSWDDFWDQYKSRTTPEVADAAGNKVSYFIHRMCTDSGPTNKAGCSFAPTDCVPNHDPSSPICVKANLQVYYRITAKVLGPRNTTSYVQSIIAM